MSTAENVNVGETMGGPEPLLPKQERAHQRISRAPENDNTPPRLRLQPE